MVTPPPSGPRGTPPGATWVVTGALSGAITTAAATWLADAGPVGPRAGGAVAAAGLGLAVGGALGGLESILARRLEAPLARLGGRFRPFVDREAEVRGPVILLHAVGVAAAGALLALAAVTALVLVRLRSVQNVALQEGLAVASVVMAAAVATLGAAAITSPLRRWLARLDVRARLPWPGAAPVRRIVWLALPLVAAGAVGLGVLGRALGPFVAPFAVLLVVAVQIALLALTGARGGARRPSTTRVTAAWAAGAIAIGLSGAHVAASRWPGAVAAIDRSPWASSLARAARGLTDVDRDGASSLFGGQDCAPTSAARRPGASDVPGNGVDEDCSGADAAPGLALPTGPRSWKGARGRPRDVVWFVIDALRADHTGALGHDRPTTPNIDRLAEESLVFSRATSQSSATMLSFPSFLTGLDPGRLTWRIERGRLQLGGGQPTLAERLGAMGYRTGFVAGDYFKRRLPGLTEGWSWVGYSMQKQTESSSSAAALAASFIARAHEGDAPLFLVVYLPAPHAPYAGHGAGYPSFGKAPVDLYDAEIVNADRYVGFVLDLLRSKPERWKDTVVVATGDHGEEFGEHGGTEHARTCHVESLHVPIVLRAPGEEPARVDVPVGLIDLVPTMLDLVGASARAEELDGHSLLLARHEPEALPEGRPLFCSVRSQKATQGSFFHRAVRSGRWVAMKDLRGAQGLSLYDAERDPGETTPVAPEGEAGEAARRLEAWLDLQLTSNLGDVPLGGEGD